MKKSSLLLLVLLLFVSINSFSQEEMGMKDLYESKEITFYGHDFSNFRLFEPSFYGHENMKKFFKAWLGYHYFSDKNEKTLSRWLKKDVTLDLRYTTSLIDHIKEDEIVSFSQHLIPKDSVQAMISRYQVAQTEGIGLVVILECFNKDKEGVSGYFVWFDIATKKIILSDYRVIKRYANGMGLTKHWGKGVDVFWHKYIDDVYRKRMKRDRILVEK